MDSNRLKYFLVVAETDSIRKAAEVLHITPAALSKAIKQLEFEVGSTLLVPAGRGIAITTEGRELVVRAQPLIQGLSQLKKDLREIKKSKNVAKLIRIGTFEVFSTYFLNNLIDALPEKVELLLRETIPGEMERCLLNQEIDFGITYLPIPMTGLCHQQIAFAEMRIYGRLNVFNKVPFEKIPFAIPVQPLIGSPNNVQGMDGWPDGTVSRFVKYRVGMLESAMELCRQGKAVAYLPSFVVNLHNKITKPEYNLYPIPFPAGMKLQKQGIYVINRKSDSNNQFFQSITKALRKVCY